MLTSVSNSLPRKINWRWWYFRKGGRGFPRLERKHHSIPLSRPAASRTDGTNIPETPDFLRFCAAPVWHHDRQEDMRHPNAITCWVDSNDSRTPRPFAVSRKLTDTILLDLCASSSTIRQPPSQTLQHHSSRATGSPEVNKELGRNHESTKVRNIWLPSPSIFPAVG